MTKQKLIVIGNGMAGSRFCAEMVERGGTSRFDLTVFGDEPGGAYNRILLSDVLNGSRQPHAIETHSLEWYRSNGIELRAGVKVVAIDRLQQRVMTEQGEALDYDVLVLATGSRAFIPPMQGLLNAEGQRKAGIFVLRTLADCERVSSYATKATSAAVIGGGLLGLEAARGLMQHGAHVHLVHRSDTLMNAQLDYDSADLLRRQIEMMGITVNLNKDTSAILGDECVTGLGFKDGTVLNCDMVVVACGVVPNVELASDAGLEVQKAIVVDDELRVAGEENIYALGECAQHNNATYGLVAPAWEQARVLAQILSGQNLAARYLGSKTSTKLKVMGIELASIGRPHEEEGDEVIQYMEPRRGRYKKLIIRNGRLAGAILLGDTRKSAVLTQAFDRGLPLPDERAGLLFDIGRGGDSGAELSDEAQVCNCNAVSAGSIRGCIRAGAEDMDAVMKQTRAGTGCGSCKSSVMQLLKEKQKASSG